MSYVFAVITDVCEPETGGNLANLFELYSEDEPASENNGYMGRWKLEPGVMLANLRVPVFYKGEILILDGEHGREVGYPGRKPSKWSVEVAHYAELDDAVEHSRRLDR